MALFAAGVPLGLCLALYVILLITPIPLPFLRDQALGMVRNVMPPTTSLELGDMALALEHYAFPVIKFSPVAMIDTKSGARVHVDALEVGFSPLRALVGQPGASITVVGPHLQLNQDLLGPRLTRLEIVDDPKGGRPTVRVIEGEDAFPAVHIDADGLEVQGDLPESVTQGVRSDNDWLIFNLEAAAQSLTDVITQADQGRFSRLVVRDGVVDMNDAVYGLFRQFRDIKLDVTPTPDGLAINGDFAASLGGRVMNGSVGLRTTAGGTSRLTASVTNIDFASVMPFIDDPESMAALTGAGALSVDVEFDSFGKVLGGVFNVDMTGTDLRIEDKYFPVVSSIMKIEWDPDGGQFTLDGAELRIGRSSAHLGGLFKLGFDKAYGPTVGMSITARNVSLHPNDMAAPETPFTQMEFTGWSAPLYGALGIDQMVASKPGARLATTGRIDMVRGDLGFDLTVGGEGVTADDLKRLWPYLISGESRDWFVENVTSGQVVTSQMHFRYPLGSVPKQGEDKPIPPGGIMIDMIGTGVAIKATEAMAPIEIEGETRLTMRDKELTVAGQGATIRTDGGNIDFANAALVMGRGTPDQDLIEISGDVAGGIPALVALVKDQQPQALSGDDLPFDVSALKGDVAVTLVSTILLNKEQPPKVDYALNGTVRNFGSAKPIQSHSIDAGQLMFTASQAGYRITGQAKVDGLDADVMIEGALDGVPEMTLSSELDTKDLAKMGFDASAFLAGKVRFAARPMADGSIQMAVDVKDAALTIKDLGITKAKGVAGSLKALVKQVGNQTEMSQIALAFGDVRLEGGLTFDGAKNQLVAAEFSHFQLSRGDSARARLAPFGDGYALTLRGEQLDLKPMLQRFFNLGEGSGGPQATQFTQALSLDVELARAIGFYKTTAYNVDLDLALKGSDLRKVNLTAQFSETNSVSVTTNPTPDGRTMSVAFNDLGSILRLVGVYARVEGGDGSLVLQTNKAQKTDLGQLLLRNFALIDEANVAQVLGNHRDSRALIAQQNKLAFKSARVDFLRKPDRIEVLDGVLTGNAVGGTMRGFIYTDAKTYDLTGTYVPLFGLNSVFQKLPLFGPLLGGREGEGLIGVTFAVRGPLDNPAFRINPVSALVPGAFRSLFEFRAREMPDAE